MGAILTENIFAWPGMGTMILNSINNRDYTVIQGVVVMAAGIFVIINMLVDIVFILIDPRVDYSGEGGALIWQKIRPEKLWTQKHTKR